MTNHEAIRFLHNMIDQEHGRSIGADGFYRELCAYHVDALRTAIKALSQRRWIPVSEGLPEEHKIYLVTYVTKTGRRYVRDCECSYAGQSPRHIEWSKKISGDVIAWMPLPEPYKAESEEQA